jgi:hypothetical protein
MRVRDGFLDGGGVNCVGVVSTADDSNSWRTPAILARRACDIMDRAYQRLDRPFG